MAKKKSPLPAAADNVDIREQLYNEGETGLEKDIAIPVVMVTKINGIMFDIDQKYYRESQFIPVAGLSPDEFYKQHLAKWLNHHAVLAKAEVRCSGTGLHVILRPRTPIELRTAEERSRWEARIAVIQTALPADPNQPGILAMTRKLDSINSKNHAEVRLLREGQGIEEAELIALVAEICQAPLTLLFRVLTGQDRMKCVLCNDQPLKAMGHVGRCYECGNVSVYDFLSTVFVETKTKSKTSSVSTAAGSKEAPHAA